MIFLIRGTSCSGKDTFISKHFPEHTVLSSDKFRMMLFNDVLDQSKNQIMFEHLRNVLELRMQFGCPFTVINATNLKFKDCRPYFDLADKFHQGVTVISIDPPSVDELDRRSTERGMAGGLHVPRGVLERHFTSYYNCMPRFIEAMRMSSAYVFIRVGQDGEIINETT